MEYIAFRRSLLVLVLVRLRQSGTIPSRNAATHSQNTQEMVATTLSVPKT